MSDIAGAARQTPPTETFIVTTGTQGAALTPTGLSAGDLIAHISVQAVGGDINVRFGTSSVAAATANDWVIPDGQGASFFVGKGNNYVSVAGAGAMRWHVSS